MDILLSLRNKMAIYLNVYIPKISVTKVDRRLTLPTVCKTKSTSHLLTKVLLSSTWNHHF